MILSGTFEILAAVLGKMDETNLEQEMDKEQANLLQDN